MNSCVLKKRKKNFVMISKKKKEKEKEMKRKKEKMKEKEKKKSKPCNPKAICLIIWIAVE